MRKLTKIRTKRLDLVPLSLEELNLWITNLTQLEEKLGIYYQAEKIEGFFLEIIKGQIKTIEKDEENYLWHTFWLMVRRQDRVVIGSIDFKNTPNYEKQVEIGYGIGKPFENNGYTTEAVKGLIDYAYLTNEVKCILAETEKDNIASIKILKKLSFRLLKEKENYWWIKNIR